jgi:uncharacterized phage-like protein YoqJ
MVTGHRPQHLHPDTWDWIEGELDRIAYKLRDEHGTLAAISGMALGTDQWWAQSALRADLYLWAHVPFPQQPDPWGDDLQAAYRRLLDEAHEIKTYGDLDTVPQAMRRREAVRLLHARNRGMIQATDAVVAVYRPSKADGGTAAAWKQAIRDGLQIIHINPDRRTVTLPRRSETPSTNQHQQETLIA